MICHVFAYYDICFENRKYWIEYLNKCPQKYFLVTIPKSLPGEAFKTAGLLLM